MAKTRRQYRRTFIKQWREYRNLTQAQLASRVGISEPHLSLIENGRRQYTQETLEALADALGTTAASLLMRDPSRDDALWTIWDGLEPAERQQAAVIIDALKKASNH